MDATPQGHHIKIRIVAAVVAGAATLGMLAVVLLSFAYNGAVNSPDDTSQPGIIVTGAAAPTVAPVVAGSIAAPAEIADLPLPTEAGIPADWPAAEKENAVSWLAMQGFTDQCMDDAGFPEYTHVASWQRVGPLGWHANPLV